MVNTPEHAAEMAKRAVRREERSARSKERKEALIAAEAEIEQAIEDGVDVDQIAIMKAEAKRARRQSRNLGRVTASGRFTEDRGYVSVVLSVLLSVIVIVAVVVGGYMLGWWLEEDAVNRRAEINQDSYNRQNALVEQILDDVREVQGPNVPPNQYVAIVDQICDSAAKLTGSIELPYNTAAFIQREC